MGFFKKFRQRKRRIKIFLSRKNLINESVNFSKKSIFVAIPKTGTTSVRRQLREFGSPVIRQPHLSIAQIKKIFYVYALKNNLSKNRQFPSKSILDEKEVSELADKLFYSFFKFAGVRNPFSRVVSLYNRREGNQHKNKMNFKQFCYKINYSSDTCLHPTLHKNQLDWLMIGNKMVMDYIYKIENFSSAINQIYERTEGRLKIKNIYSNVNPKSFSNNYHDYYDVETKNLIYKKFQKDFEHFEYSY